MGHLLRGSTPIVSHELERICLQAKPLEEGILSMGVDPLT